MKKFLYSILAACTLMFAATSCDTEEGGDFEPMPFGISATSKGPWSVDITVNQGTEGTSFFVGIEPKNNRTDAEGDEVTGSAYDEDRFVTAAEGAIANDFAPKGYGIYTRQSNYTLSLNEFDLSAELAPATAYVAAVYTVAEDGTYEVKTSEFTTAAFPTTLSQLEGANVAVECDAASATVTITLDGNYRGVAYGTSSVELQPAELANWNFNNNFEAFDGSELTFSFPLFNSDYYIYAVAIAEDGQIAGYASNTASPEYPAADGAAVITACTFGELTHVEDEFTQNRYKLTANIATTDATVVRIFCQNAGSGAIENVERSMWTAEEGFNVFEFEVAQDDNYTWEIRSRAGDKHYVYATAKDAAGKWSPIYNLGNLSTADKDNFNTPAYTHEEENGGGSDDDDRWVMNTFVWNTNVLSLTNITITAESLWMGQYAYMFSSDVKLSGVYKDTLEDNNITKVHILGCEVTLGNGINNFEEAVKDFFTEESEPKNYVTKLYSDAPKYEGEGEDAVLSISVPKSGEGDTQSVWDDTYGGYLYAVVFENAEGKLIMTVVGYVTGTSTENAEPTVTWAVQ